MNNTVCDTEIPQYFYDISKISIVLYIIVSIVIPTMLLSFCCCTVLPTWKSNWKRRQRINELRWENVKLREKRKFKKNTYRAETEEGDDESDSSIVV
jgi:hypothetical protein